MSGGTRCNVTHREVSERDFHGGSRPFVARVLRAFTADQTLAWFAEMGVELKLEETDLNDLLAAQVMLYSAQSAHHELQLDPADDALVVFGDRDRLAQVIGNLLSNAIKYSPEGGLVGVSASLVGDEAWIWVRDQGLGIPTDQQQRVFTKFFRGDVGRERGISGTGLGLVLARQIVEAHGGEIGFESEAGAGSTFWLQFPAAHAGDDGRPPGGDARLAAHDDPEARHGV